MRVRHVVVAVAVTTLAGIAVPAGPSYAAGSTDVYVTSTGSDTADCSQATPCLTVSTALAAVADGGTVHVGPGTFDGSAVIGTSVTIAGAGTDQTTLTTPQDSGPGYVLEVGTGTTALSDLAIQGGFAVDLLVDGGTVTGQRVLLDDSYCNLAVESGSVSLTDSAVLNGGQGCVTPTPTAEIAISGGHVSLVRTTVGSGGHVAPGVSMSGGTFSAVQSFFDDGPDFNSNSASAVVVGGGSADVSQSTFRGWGYDAVDVTGGTATLTDDTFQGDLVAVNRESGSATVVRSTFEANGAALQGDVGIAGSVISGSLIDNCGPGTVTDLGYNLAEIESTPPDTCGFSGTSRNVPDLHLDSGLADWGGPVPTVATTWPSPAVDAIPAGATYGVSATPLCAGTDLRGVPRPQAGGCDAGSMELVATTIGLKAPATGKPHAGVTLDATVALPDVGVSGIEVLGGSVTFRSGTTVLCHDVVVVTGKARCVTTALGAGRRRVNATFTPVPGSTLHRSVSATRTIEVGTLPVFTSRSRATFVVGTSHTFRVRASGSPAPRITLVRGRLPSGLTFRAGTGTATLSGRARASAVGSHWVTVQATNLRGSVRQPLKIVVSRS